MLPATSATLFIVYHTCMFASDSVLQNVYTESYGKHNLITNFYLITEFTSNVILYSKFVVNKGILNKVVRELIEVAYMIRLIFGGQPEMNKLFKCIRMKMFWISFTYPLDICLYLLPSIVLGDKLKLSVHMEASQSATAIGCMHGLLYIKLSGFYMKTLNKTLI